MGGFPTADGHMVVAAFNQGFWRNLCRALGKAEWLDKPVARPELWSGDGRVLHWNDTRVQKAGENPKGPNTRPVFIEPKKSIPATRKIDLIAEADAARMLMRSRSGAVFKQRLHVWRWRILLQKSKIERLPKSIFRRLYNSKAL